MLAGLAYAGMFLFGIVMALLGAVIPALSTRLSLGLDDVGTLFLVTNASMLAASLLVGPATDRFGMKTPLAFGAFVVGASLIGIAAVHGTAGLLLAAAALGFGGGALNATTNILIADLHDDPDRKASALNLLGVFFGFGALLLPFTVGALLSRAGLGGLLTGAAALCAITGLASLVPRFPAPKQAQGFPLARMPQFIRMPLVLALACLLFFQSGNEFILGGYLATFFTREMGAPVETAAYVLAAYWGVIMLSRLALSRALVRVGAYRAIAGGAVLAAAGAVMLALSQTTGVAVAGALVTGTALAGIFPAVLGIAGAAYAQHSGTVFGILFTIALTGGMTLPWVAGQLAQGSGVRTVFMLAAGGFLAIAALSAVARRASVPTATARA